MRRPRSGSGSGAPEGAIALDATAQARAARGARASGRGPRWRPSVRLVRALAWACVIAIGVVSVTGATVRLTGSGLGCSTWPECQPGSLAPDQAVGVPLFHQLIEFGHRVVAGTALALSLGMFVLVRLLRPVRRQLTWLAGVGPAGILVQAVLGAVVVFTELRWWMVTAHLLLPLLLLFVAVVVVVRLNEPDGPVRYLIPRPLVVGTWVMVVVLVAVAVLGTLTSAAGPHGGDRSTPRLGLEMSDLMVAHRTLLWCYLGLIVVLGVGFVIVRAPQRMIERTLLLVGATCVQAAIGLTQWALGVPANLVIAHIAGAALVVGVAASVVMAMRTREPAGPPGDLALTTPSGDS